MKTFAVIGTAAALALGACSAPTAEAVSQEEPVYILEDMGYVGNGLRLLRDRETGCEYFYRNGLREAAITPRVDTNGYYVCSRR